MPTESAVATRGAPVWEPLRLAPDLRLLSVDVEDRSDARGEAGVLAILELLAGHETRATFFVPGRFTRQQRGLVRRIADAGHEVGCRACDAEPAHAMPAQRFREAVREARAQLQDDSGQPVRGFRAPYGSVDARSPMAFEVLIEAGFEYDSSVRPAWRSRHAIAGPTTGAYRIELASGDSLFELPPSRLRLGPLRLGIAGGAFLRALPLFVQRLAMRACARRGEPFMLCVRPRDLAPRVGSQRATPRRLRALLELGGWQALAGALDHAAA